MMSKLVCIACRYSSLFVRALVAMFALCTLSIVPCMGGLVRTIDFASTYLTAPGTGPISPPFDFYFTAYNQTGTEQSVWGALDLPPTLNTAIVAPPADRDALGTFLTTHPVVTYDERVVGSNLAPPPIFGPSSVTDYVPSLSGLHIDNITLTITQFDIQQDTGPLGHQTSYTAAFRYDVYSDSVPEPQTLTMVLLGAAPLLSRNRQRVRLPAI